MPAAPLPVAHVGIDPASSTGVAVVMPNGAVYSAVVADPLRATLAPIVGDVMLAIPKGVRGVAAVERPPSGLRGAAVPRFLGAQYEALLRRAYPRRLKVLTPTPTQWQAAMLGKTRKGGTKAASLLRATELLGREVASNDEADAVNLAHWARALGDGL